MRCKQGDLAEIIESTDGISVGRIVQCVSLYETHWIHGPCWVVRSKDDLMTEYGSVGKTAHVPDKWLRPIKPGELDKKTTKTLEKTE